MGTRELVVNISQAAVIIFEFQILILRRHQYLFPSYIKNKNKTQSLQSDRLD